MCVSSILVTWLHIFSAAEIGSETFYSMLFFFMRSTCASKHIQQDLLGRDNITSLLSLSIHSKRTRSKHFTKPLLKVRADATCFRVYQLDHETEWSSPITASISRDLQLGSFQRNMLQHSNTVTDGKHTNTTPSILCSRSILVFPSVMCNALIHM